MAEIILITKLIPLIIAYLNEKKSQKVVSNDFLYWLIENNHNEVVKEIKTSSSASIYVKALLNEKLPILEELQNNDEKIIQYLKIQDSKLDLVIETQKEMIEILNLDPKHIQVFNYFFNKLDLAKVSTEAATESIKLRIDEFSDYSKKDSHSLKVEKLSDDFDTLIKGGNILEAKYILDISLKKDESELNSKSKLISVKAYHLGKLSYYLSQYHESIKYFEKALEYDKNNFKYLKDLAKVNNVLGFHTLALEYYKSAHELLNNKKNNTLEIAHVISDIGLTYEYLGFYNKALVQYETANKITHDCIGKNNNSYVSTLNNIAHLNARNGQFDEALIKFIEVLNFDTKTKGTNHIDLASSYNNIGGVFQKHEKFDKALNFFLKAIEVYKYNSKEAHYKYAILIMNIAICHSGKDNHALAIQEYKKAEKLLIGTFNENHRDVALVRSNMAYCMYLSGQKNKAIDYMNKAYKSYQLTLGNFHPDTKETKILLKKMKNCTL